MKRYSDDEIRNSAPDILAYEVMNHMNLVDGPFCEVEELTHATKCISAASDIPAKNITAALFAMRFLAQETAEQSADLREQANEKTRELFSRLPSLIDAMLDPSLSDQKFGEMVTGDDAWPMDSTNHSIGRAMRGLFRYVGSILVGDDTDFAACVDVIDGLTVSPYETGEIPTDRNREG